MDDEFVNGTCVVEIDNDYYDGYAVIDKNEKIIMKYDEISRLSETDLFKVENEKGDCGVADISGKLIVECKYDYINLVSWDYGQLQRNLHDKS